MVRKILYLYTGKFISYIWLSTFPSLFMHQVVVASFFPEKENPKRQRVDHSAPTAPPTSSHINNHVSAEELRTDIGGMKPIMSPAGFNFASFGNGQGSGNSSSSADDEHV